jgi:hypothetical protein
MNKKVVAFADIKNKAGPIPIFFESILIPYLKGP